VRDKLGPKHIRRNAALVIRTARRVISMVWLLGGIQCGEKQSLRHEADDDTVRGAGWRADEPSCVTPIEPRAFVAAARSVVPITSAAAPSGAAPARTALGIALGETRRIVEQEIRTLTAGVNAPDAVRR